MTVSTERGRQPNKRPPELHVITATHRPVIVDIYTTWRAEVAARDWAACHVAGDRRQPIDLCERPKRGWRA